MPDRHAADSPVAVQTAPGLPDVGVTHVVRAGQMIYVSGQLALDEHGVLVGDGDCQAQAVCCLGNIEAALRAVGSSRAEIVKLVCYLTATDHFGGYALAKASFFQSTPPASTTVVVNDLLVPGALLEVEAIAHAGVTAPARP